MAHIKRCVECERSQNAAKTAQERLEEMKGQIEQLLWRQLPSVEDHTKRELVRYVMLEGGREPVCDVCEWKELCLRVEGCVMFMWKELGMVRINHNMPQFRRRWGSNLVPSSLELRCFSSLRSLVVKPC